LSNEANGKIYNRGHSEVISLKALAELMIDIFGHGSCEQIPFPPDRKAIDIGDYYSDFSKIQKNLGWSPKVKLSEGLEKTINFYLKNREHYWEVNK